MVADSRKAAVFLHFLPYQRTVSYQFRESLTGPDPSLCVRAADSLMVPKKHPDRKPPTPRPVHRHPQTPTRLLPSRGTHISSPMKVRVLKAVTGKCQHTVLSLRRSFNMFSPLTVSEPLENNIMVTAL